MVFLPQDKSIRFSGRWNITKEQAVTTAPGGMFEIAFTGRLATMHFDISTNVHPYPHLWISVDGGARVEAPLDRYLRVEASSEGEHIIRAVFKSAIENQHRWYPPLVGKVSFCGYEADGAGVLPPDNRRVIEFIGDSITEGVLADKEKIPHAKNAEEVEMAPENLDGLNRARMDDATATYAYLTAEHFGLRPVIMGYGAVGTTCSGSGAVPRVTESYPYCYFGAEYHGSGADYIVINHGTNDGYAPAEVYLPALEELICLVRKRNPKAKIAVIFPFFGYFHDELAAFIPGFNEKYKDDILAVDTRGWLPKFPVHPSRDGHRIAADKLIAALKDWITIEGISEPV